ncbi:hypothetical protein FQZ97_948450 [compost metagenome]
MFEKNGIACHQCRDDGVDGSEIRIIPRRNDHNNAKRNVLYITAETILLCRHIRFQHFFGDVDHILAAFLHAAIFTAIARWAAHLPGNFRNDCLLHCGKCIQCRTTIAGPFCDARCGPSDLRLPCCSDCSVDRGVTRIRTLRINRAINWGDDLGCAAHRAVPLYEVILYFSLFRDRRSIPFKAAM